jgi:dienelactone hydrolase
MIKRRTFIRTLVACAGASPLGACGHHAARRLCPGPHSDFQRVPWLAADVWRIGPEGGRAVVLLHELPGLTDDDLALARCLAREGFKVYTPLLFGTLGQDDFVNGFLKACKGTNAQFRCSELRARSPVLDMLEPLCDRIAERSGGSIAVIGMCLTGILPLAVLPNGVAAAVLCQPTLPFDAVKMKPVGPQEKDLGLGDGDLKDALDSKTPFLAIHYGSDPLSPHKRFETLSATFGAYVAIIELPGHRKHSSLAGDLEKGALADTITYLKVRLGVEPGPKRMHVAKLGGMQCEISQSGTWMPIASG